MAHEMQHPYEIIKKPGALLMGAVLVGGLVEVGRTIKEARKEDIADVKSYPHVDGPSFVFLRGCGENYLAQAPMHERRLGDFGSLHFPYQLQGRHSQKIIDEGLIEAYERSDEQDIYLVCSSMGLMNAMRSFKNPEVRDALGPGRLKGIISRSGMTSRADLQPSMQKAASISAHTPKLAVVGDLWRAHRMRQAHLEVPHSPEVSRDEVIEHHESSARMPFPLVASQYYAVHTSTPWPEASHVDVSEEHPDLKLYQITAEYDGVVNRKAAKRSLEASFQLPVEPMVDYRRHHGSHAEDIEFMEPLIQIMARASNRHESMLRAVTNLEEYRHRRQYASAS